jgi:hypothetical protein
VRQAKPARSVGASPTQVVPSKPPGGECCVSRRQRRPRSVHSCCMGCAIEPRNTLIAGGGGIPLLPNATCPVALGEALDTLPGSESTSRAEGSCRNLGGPASGQSSSLPQPGPGASIDSPTCGSPLPTRMVKVPRRVGKAEYTRCHHRNTGHLVHPTLDFAEISS